MSSKTPLFDAFTRVPAAGTTWDWGSAATGAVWSTGFAHGSGFRLAPEPGPAISPEDYAIIDEVIIDSVARGYVQRRRDGIDRA